jgi:hypothetical protein
MHEDFSRSPEIKGSSDRSFGLVVAAFFALVAVLPVLHRPPSSVRWWALAVAAGFLTFALLRSRTLRPLNRAWQKLGLLLSRIAGPVVLALLFYAVVTPVGLLMRVSGNDPLRLRRRKPVSYWIAREPPGPAPETMKNQF